MLHDPDPYRPANAASKRALPANRMSAFALGFRNGVLWSMLISIPATYLIRNALARDFNRRYNLEMGSIEILDYSTAELLRFSLHAGLVSLCIITLPWALAAGYVRMRYAGDRSRS